MGRRLLTEGLSWLLTAAFPFLLVLLLVRAVMAPWFLTFEYTRPDMPPDYYGFSLEERLQYGPVGIEYITTSAEISLLGDLTFPNGAPLFTERELDHMVDVKVVTNAAFALMAMLLAIVPITVVALRLLCRTWRPVLMGIQRGAMLTLGIIGVVVVGAVVAWDVFFTTFHQLFFSDGTWLFFTSDTLIRLYPEKFWFDAAILIGTATVLLSIATIVLCWRLLHRESSVKLAP
jgi:integral membrane protein (TIGR01906 family)